MIYRIYINYITTPLNTQRRSRITRAQVQEPKDDIDEDHDQDDGNVSVEKGPNNEEAFQCFETGIKWAEQQDECDAVFKTPTRLSGKKTGVKA
ncbi:hypothetical protein J6590_035335 [Homalodisca vitripennis]|nr:hypothetical protein J6590_035335 [Homalodisca vitripennis]